MMTLKDISQEREKFCILHELGNKMQLGFWVPFELLTGFSGGQGGKAFEKFTVFSLKLVR